MSIEFQHGAFLAKLQIFLKMASDGHFCAFGKNNTVLIGFSLYLQAIIVYLMGQLAFLKTFILVAMSIDANDNRRHVHVFQKGQRHLKSVAKIWIESNGEKCIEIAESTLSAKENKMLADAIDRHWEYINEQITITFRGEKTRPINIE